MEERVARLEIHVEHIQSDIAEMKLDVRGIHGEIKEIRGEMKEMDRRLSSRIDGLALVTEKSFAVLNVSRMADRVWWLMMSAALLAVVARAFKWI